MRKILFIFIFLIPVFVISGCGTAGKTLSLETPPAQIDVNQSSVSSVVFAGDSRSSPVFLDQPSPVVDLPFVAPASTTITQNNPDTWPRHYFKELGFSIRLPFPTESIYSEYFECKDSYAYDLNGKPATDEQAFNCSNATGTYYLFRAFVDSPWAKTDNTVFMQHVSNKHSFRSGPTLSFNALWNSLAVGNFSRHNKRSSYAFIFDGTEIPPLPIIPIRILNMQGRAVSIFDMNREAYQMRQREKMINNSYAILVKLNGNKHFPMIALQFWQEATGTTLKQVEAMAKSIRFD